MTTRTNKLALKEDTTGFSVSHTAQNLTANRNITWQDRNGTPADLQNLQETRSSANYYMDGTSTNIAVADNDLLSFSNLVGDLPFTIMCSAAPAAGVTEQTLVSKMVFATGEYTLRLTNGFLDFSLQDTTAGKHARFGCAFVPDGKPHTFTGSYDGRGGYTGGTSGASDGLSVYIDGIKQSAVYSDTENAYVKMRNGTNPVYIGSDSVTPANWLRGNVSRVLIFNYQLPDDHVLRYSMGGKLDWDDVGGNHLLYNAANSANAVSETTNSITGWVTGFGTPTFAAVSGGAHTGTYRLDFTGAANGARVDYAFPVTKGKKYKVAYYTKGKTGVPVYLYAATSNSGDNFGALPAVFSGYDSPSTSGTYTLGSFTFTADATGTYYLSMRQSAAGASYFSIDSITISQQGTVLDLEPENMSAIKWYDNANNLHGTVTAALSNTLFQEGTWTPANNGGVAYASSFGFYVRMGNLCYIQCVVNFGTETNGLGAQILGLPFTPRSDSNMQSSMSIGYCTALASSGQISARVAPGTASIILADAGGGLALTNFSTKNIMVSGFYRI